MIPAETKKKESIVEYIVYMYQTEDLIISYNFNLDDIYEYVIKHISKDEIARKELLLWYASITEQMNAEKISDSKKRLKSTQSFVAELTRLHHLLLADDKVYNQIYSKANDDINHHISLSKNTIASPIQICLNGIYGLLLLRLDGKNISPEQQATLTEFGSVLTYLSNAYKKSNFSK